MIKQNTRILIADDEEEFRYMLKIFLESEGFEVEQAADGIQAINLIQMKAFEIALLDIKIPKVDGVEVLKFIEENFPNIDVVMLTGVGDVRIAVECMKSGAYDYVNKPYSTEELLKIIERIVEKQNLIRENQAIKAQLSRITGSEEIIGISSSLKRITDVALKVAPTNSTILIQGQSGTGKELIANFIYKNSTRADKPLVALNCASIPDSLIESELFGHEKGAFTDAHITKQGLVELANNGTLFLDEIGDISPIIQPKLLRFIQTGEFRRVGGNMVLKSDVRLISATNKNLMDEVKKGTFREDLLYRLNVITLDLPLLKERREDIPILIEYFLTKKAGLKTRKQISPKATEFLMKYEWPGNIRELENVIERAAILSKDDMIQPFDLSLPLKTASFLTALNQEEIIGSMIPMKEVEKKHIFSVLKNLNGNKAEAAKILGISLKTLYTKILQYQIEI